MTMDNAGVCVYRDEKPAIFAPEGYAGGRIVYPAFFSSREVKEMGIDTTKIRSSRSTGILLAPSGIFVTYNSSSALMKWRYKSEMRVKALIWSVICQQRLSPQFRHEDVHGLILGNSMDLAYQILTSTGGRKHDFFMLDGSYEHFLYLTNDHQGEVILALLCDPGKTAELDRILLQGLTARQPGLAIEHDGISPDGSPVLFQSELIKKITAKNEIDLELPGQQPCAYFLVTSDQDSTFDFLASLFLSFCFIKLVRYADHNCEGGKLPVPVHILGEELTACGTIPDLSRRLSVIRSRNISMSCVFQNLAGLQNRYPQNLWQEIIGNCDAQLFLGCTDQLTAEFISARTGLASVAVSSKSKQLGTWRISNYTPEFRETSGVGKRPVLTPDEVLRLPLDQALIIIRGKKVLQVDKMDYSKHPEAKYLRSCKASAHVPEWRRLEEEAAKTPQPTPKPAPAAKKPAKRKATKPASPTDKSPKEAPAPKSAGTPEGIITTDKDSILS